MIRTARSVESPAVRHVEHDAQNGQIYFTSVRAVVPTQTGGVEERTHFQPPFDNRQAAQHVLDVLGGLVEEVNRQHRQHQHRDRKQSILRIQTVHDDHHSLDGPSLATRKRKDDFGYFKQNNRTRYLAKLVTLSTSSVQR